MACTALGTVLHWSAFLWTTAAPLPFIVLIFKFWITRTLGRQFRYYVPDKNELARSQAHSQLADTSGRLGKRFGHPALHADLFTPMVHGNSVHLLAEVYHGRLGQEQKALDEYGGQKINTSIVPGGIRIAGIDAVSTFFVPGAWKEDVHVAALDQHCIRPCALPA